MAGELLQLSPTLSIFLTVVLRIHHDRHTSALAAWSISNALRMHHWRLASPASLTVQIGA